MKLKVNKSKEAIAESTGGSYISKTGIYDVTIKFASLDVAASGAERVNFNIDYNGNSQTIWGPWVTSKANTPIEIGMKLINSLAVIAGIEEGEELTFEEETHKVGKDNKPQEFTVIEQFTDLPCKMRLQEEYSINPKTNDIKKTMVLKSFFREDGASAIECESGENIGARLALETERYGTNITYKDDLTPDDIKKWLDGKKTGDNKASAKKPAPTVKKAAARKPMFQ